MSKRHSSKRSRSDSPTQHPDRNSTDEEYAAESLIMLSRGVTETSKIIEQIKPPQRAEYKCSICNKAFNSYQALGGHTASHKKNYVAPGSESASAVPGKKHQCNRCYKSYPTGQALGGHMRLHFDGGKSKITPLDVIGTNFTYDLNLPGSSVMLPVNNVDGKKSQRLDEEEVETAESSPFQETACLKPS